MSRSAVITNDENTLRVDDVHKTYGTKDGFKALDGVSLTVPKGQLVVLLGPSGCGKTTLLRILAGLEDAAAGRVTFFGRPVVDTTGKIDVPARHRNVGMVFQNYALWPHMTVVDNVAYPLRNKRVPKDEARARARDMLRLLKCDHLEQRLPAQLSGGQQQRIALGRALVASPQLVFFDEPLSNVDAQLRREVRGEIRRLHQEIAFTGIYVTHDLGEALELADTIVVMSNGRVEQVGTPQEIFERPSSAYVADFMGIENKFTARVSGSSVHSELGSFARTEAFASLLPDREYRVFIRASDVAVAKAGDHPGDSALHGWLIRDIMYGGDHTDLALEKNGHSLVSSGGRARRPGFSVGDHVDVVLPADGALVFPADTKVP